MILFFLQYVFMYQQIVHKKTTKSGVDLCALANSGDEGGE